MDYSDERCRNMFSYGQIALMRNVLRINRPLLAEAIVKNNPVDPPTPTVTVTPYPNPFGDYFNMYFSTPLDQELTVEVYDMLGHKLMDAQVPSGTTSFQVNMFSQPNAVYAMRYTLYGKEYKHKLIKL